MTERVRAADTVTSEVAEARPMSQPDGSGATSTTDVAYGGSGTRANVTETVPNDDGDSPLFTSGQAQDFRSRWQDVQVRFVDDPRQAVQAAETLVSDTVNHLAEIFAEERQNLESQWSSGADVSTEDLRLALQRYRSFFNRLLSI